MLEDLHLAAAAAGHQQPHLGSVQPRQGGQQVAEALALEFRAHKEQDKVVRPEMILLAQGLAVRHVHHRADLLVVGSGLGQGEEAAWQRVVMLHVLFDRGRDRDEPAIGPQGELALLQSEIAEAARAGDDRQPYQQPA